MELRAQLSTPLIDCNGDVLNHFLSLLMKYLPLEDALVTETMLTLYPDAIAALYGQNPSATKRLIETFCEETAASARPFSYTDVIAERCTGIFCAVDNPDVRAMLVACLASLGSDHNRWKVLRTAARLLEREKEPVELVALMVRLKGVPRRHLEAVGEHAQLPKLEMSLQELPRPKKVSA